MSKIKETLNKTLFKVGNTAVTVGKGLFVVVAIVVVAVMVKKSKSKK